MNILVMKFGGTSVEDLKSIKKVAAKIEAEAKKYKIEQLVQKSRKIYNKIKYTR